jgi:hypothetical protein
MTAPCGSRRRGFPIVLWMMIDPVDIAFSVLVAVSVVVLIAATWALLRGR